MQGKKAAEINLNKHERKIITELKNGSHTPLHLKKRSEIIILSSEGKSNSEVSRTVEMKRENVTKWRKRYALASEELRKTEAETPSKLRGLIESILSDAPRSGAPSTFTDEQIACIIALACELPENIGLPFSHWSPSLLRVEVINRGIVSSISAVHVGRFLKEARFKASSGKKLAQPENR
jgi:transposase